MKTWQPDPRAVADAEQMFVAGLEGGDLREPLEIARVLDAMGRLVVLDAAGSRASGLEHLNMGRAALVAVLDREDMRDTLEDRAIQLRDAFAHEDDELASVADEAADA